MHITSQKGHKRWLLITACVVGSFGPIFSLATQNQFDHAAQLTLDLLHWPIDGVQTYTGGTMRFLTALTGGFLFGLGVMIFFLRQWVYDLAPEPTRKAIVVSLVAWFVMDSIGSASVGAYSNVLFNVLVLLAAVGPLWWPTRAA
ncbi:hypothetical protein [Marinomonas atlantica]|uniref:hypothetical protein n=1 Tax=Marinomonas atlantica TaxID=1806668 RepID=UPI0008301004|nr:hypothetical protein [Marinomonas atlantica]